MSIRSGRFFVSLALMTLAIASCGGSNSASTTPTDPSGSIATTSAAATTDTTASPASTGDAPEADPDALAEAKVVAALGSLPDDWTGNIASDLGDEADGGSDIVFAPCLTPDDYDLDQLDADSAASWELDAEGPAAGSPFGGQRASIEARVFNAEADVDQAFAALETVLGTDDGRACLAAEVPGQLATDAPDDATFDATVEGPSIEGAQVGARIVVEFSAGGFGGEFYIDLVAARVDERCTVLATFVGFGAPVDPGVASAAFAAATEATT